MSEATDEMLQSAPTRDGDESATADPAAGEDVRSATEPEPVGETEPSTKGLSQAEEGLDAEAHSRASGYPDSEQVAQAPQEDDSDEKPVVTPGSILEALLFSTDAPLSASKMAQILGIGTPGDVKRHVEALNRRYEESGSAFRVQAIAGGFQMFTLPQYDLWMTKLHRARAESRLSQAVLETLAIVAYKQPVLRADIEAIRGVAVGDMMARLREMKLVKIVGRAEELGRPLLYGTTTRFLEVFGLSSIKDLPKLDQDSQNRVPKLKVPEAPPPPSTDGEAAE